LRIAVVLLIDVVGKVDKETRRCEGQMIINHCIAAFTV